MTWRSSASWLMAATRARPWRASSLTMAAASAKTRGAKIDRVKSLCVAVAPRPNRSVRATTVPAAAMIT
jgi:hypothetical protein